MAELELPPGPTIGWLLDALLELVLDEPRRNERSVLLQLARELLAARSVAADGAAAHRKAAAGRRASD